MKDVKIERKEFFNIVSDILENEHFQELKNEKHLIKEYYGLNHLFQPCRTGLYEEYGQIETTISPDVMKDIADWILTLRQ